VACDKLLALHEGPNFELQIVSSRLRWGTSQNSARFRYDKRGRLQNLSA